MATQTTGGGSTTSLDNTPQAKDDLYIANEDQILYFAVMANDLGGSAKILWSIDNTSDDGSADLISQDVAGVSEYSELGAKISLTSDGRIKYDTMLLDSLAAGQTVTDQFTYAIRLANGTLSWATVTVTLTGTNDAPEISVLAGDSAAACLDETNAPLTASGTLTVVDIDTTDVVDTAVTGIAVSGNQGTLTDAQLLAMLTLTGANDLAADSGDMNNLGWDFSSNSEAFDFLAAGQTLTLTYTLTSTDGNGGSDTQTVTITITGTNDAAVIAAVAGGDYAVTEAGGVANATPGDPDASGQLTVSDVDDGEDHFEAALPAALAGSYGSFTFNEATGEWSYALDQAAADALNAGDLVSDTLTVLSHDGTSYTVTVNITGTNDAAVISGTTSGSVTEAGSSNGGGTPSVSGTLTATDVDNPADTFTAVVSPAASANGYGTFTMTAGGTWTYTVDNSNPAVDALNDGDTLSDSFVVTSIDGTQQTISITINGATDNVAPVANSDILWVSSSTAVTLSTDVLLGNDTDPDGLALTVTSITLTSGTLAVPVTLNANGTFSFTTTNSPVTLTYTTSDGAGGTSIGTVTVNVVNVVSGTNADIVDLSTVGAYQGSYIDGRSGADDLTDGSGMGTLLGGTGADDLIGNSGNDLLLGGDNNDILVGGAGNDILNGGIGNNDSMDGGAGSEDLLSFSDGTVALGTAITPFVLVQSAGFTMLANGTGGQGNNDQYANMEGVIGTGLADFITGSASNDILRGGGGNDTLNGGAGTGDLIDFRDGTAGITLTLVQSALGTAFNASGAGLGIDTYSNMEGVIGTVFADTLTGSSGNDILRGDGGNDVLDGAGGNDTLNGGTGADTLTGGIGNDSFIFNSALNNVDTITDFEASSADLIVLDNDIFTAFGATTGTLAAANFAANAGGNATDGDDFILYDTTTGNLYYDADGNGSGAKILVANITVTGGIVDANDFTVI